MLHFQAAYAVEVKLIKRLFLPKSKNNVCITYPDVCTNLYTFLSYVECKRRVLKTVLVVFFFHSLTMNEDRSFQA